MMLTEWSLYWLTRLDGLRGFLEGIGIPCAILGAVSLLGWAISKSSLVYDNDESARKLLPITRWLTIGFIFVGIGIGIIHSLLPTTKEMAAILVLPRLAQNETVQEVGQGVVDLAKSWLEELKPKVAVKE